jgi:PAS domain S-box-containing protein
METATSQGRDRPVVNAESALRFLSEASAVLAGSLDYETTVKLVSELLVPDLADWCVIEVVEDSSTRLITSGADDPELEGLVDRMRPRYREQDDQALGLHAVIRDGRSILVRDASRPAAELTEAEQAVFERLATRSYMIVPLIARGRTLGAIALVSRRADRMYGPMDLAFAEHLARRFALAVDNARLYDQAERSLALLDTLFASAPVGLAFWDRDLRYVRVNARLSELNRLPVEDHIGKTLAEVVPDLADELEPRFRNVIGTGEPCSDLEMESIAHGDAGGSRLYTGSYYPVRDSAGAIIGIGGVIADITERRRGENALAAALEAEREARAAAEAAERRARFLAEASVLLDASLDYETTLQSIASLAVAEMADWCGVEVLDPTGDLRSVAVAHIDPAKVRWAREMQQRYPTDPDSGTGAPNVVRTGKAELYPVITEELLLPSAQDEEHLRLIRELDIRSAMVVPMVARGRTLGAISFIGAESGRTYDESDLALAQELARRAGMAVDNARLYTELSGIADTLQAELLPTEIPDIPGIDVAVRYRAAGELNRVGGDFYDVFRRGQNQWAVVIGDVSGKGAPAAAVTALARYTLRTAATAARTPSEALYALNEALLERRRDQEFCSVALAYVTLGENGLEGTISLGGHQPAFVRRADGRLETHGSPGLLMGFAHDPPVVDETFELHPGDMLLMYTDGVIDAARDGSRFGDERLERLLRESPGTRSAPDLTESIEAAAVEHANGHPQDDMALVAVQVPEVFVRACQFDLGGGPEAISRARHAVAEILEGAVSSERLYDVQLLVSEVVTNAVRHGGARMGEHVDLRVSLTADDVRLEVRDPGPGFNELAPALPEADSGGGYGLYLVDLYSTAWGVSAGEGTCVWFELPADGGAVMETA